ncbi:MAG TPA: DUF58 domain-containing protein [Candidatus Limnocylindria bacterium]|jgi:uncharacterized protein (DUF58 family)|nr:DUF58 domain-containing protein [Candidatus Limnocylindria bacterium]
MIRRLRPRLPSLPFVPLPRLLALVALAAAPIALATFYAPLAWAAVAICGIALVLAAIDARATPHLRSEDLARSVAPQLSIGAAERVRVDVRNPVARPLAVTVRDDPPAGFNVDRRRLDLVAPPNATATAEYAVRPRYRGTFTFGDVHSRQRGPLGLVERQSRVPSAWTVKVYPDLREIRRYEISLRRGLAYDAGQRRARVPGAGSLFARLREYGPDDDPRSISWTATARRGRPISVEYETERQQRLVILLDAGRMMSSTLGELTKLDHAVNTALMLAYVAIGKGDEVGLLGFADDVRSYLPPRRGRGHFLRMTEELRRIEVTTTEPDYRAAFEFLRARAARRALVVLFTDLVDEEASRGLVAAVTRLAGNNLVLCCLLADPQLAEVASRRPESSVALYERVVASEVRDARAKALAALRRRGVHTIDVASDRLTVATIQRYLELKKRAL